MVNKGFFLHKIKPGVIKLRQCHTYILITPSNKFLSDIFIGVTECKYYTMLI